MRVLLDENLPHDFRHFLAEHDARTTAYMNWAGLENGELLAKAAEAGFDVLLSMDRGLEYRRLADAPISIVLLRAPSNAISDLLPLVAELLKTLDSLQPGTISHVG